MQGTYISWVRRHKIKGLEAPRDDDEPVQKKWVVDDFVTKKMIENGFSVTGPIRMGNNAYVVNPKAPTHNDELVNKKYVDSHSTSGHYLHTTGGLMSGQIDMSGQKIT